MTQYQQTWGENPLQIISIPTEEIVVIPELSGRSDYKRDQNKVKELTRSIQAEGQIEPAICGLNDEGQPVMYIGFGRLEACKAASMPILCMYSSRPVSDVLVLAMHENTKREDLSPIQFAANIERLSSQGMKDPEIAKKLCVSPATVFIHKKFMQVAEDGTPLFSKFARTAIHKKEIPLREAYAFAELKTPEEIDNAIKASIDAGEAVTSKGGGDKKKKSAVSSKAREIVREAVKGKKNKRGKKKSVARTPKQVRTLLVEWDVPGVSNDARKIFAKLLQYWDGEIDEKAFEQGLKFTLVGQEAA